MTPAIKGLVKTAIILGEVRNISASDHQSRPSNEMQEQLENWKTARTQIEVKMMVARSKRNSFLLKEKNTKIHVII